MKNNGIVIIDDSPFSVAIIRNILEEEGFNVVGEANSLEEALEVITKTKPYLVTMDMTLPDTDGFECTRSIHEIDDNIRVIMISSMMDDEIVKESKRNKIIDFIQKPVDGDELIAAVEKILKADELYTFLDDKYNEVFIESLLDCIGAMTKTKVSQQEAYLQTRDFNSSGITVVIGIIGLFPGRMFIDLSKETAGKLVHSILNKEPKDYNEVLLGLGELANIISGNASSMLNRQNRALGLRIAPPSILHGDNIVISPPDFNTITTLIKTDFGDVTLNVGFKRGDQTWM